MNNQVAYMKATSNLYRILAALVDGGLDIPFTNDDTYKLGISKRYEGDGWVVEVLHHSMGCGDFDCLFTLNSFDTEEEALVWLSDGRKSTRSIKASAISYFNGDRISFGKELEAPEYDALVDSGILDGEVLEDTRNDGADINEGQGNLPYLPHHKAVAIVKTNHDRIKEAMFLGGDFKIVARFGEITYHPNGTRTSTVDLAAQVAVAFR